MAMHPHHWAWLRQRQQHHVGAQRCYDRDVDFFDLRGPNETPRGPCDRCAEAADGSHYQSFSSSSSDDSHDAWITAETGIRDVGVWNSISRTAQTAFLCLPLNADTTSPLMRFKLRFYNRRKPQIYRDNREGTPLTQSKRKPSTTFHKTTAAFRRQKYL